MKNIHNRSFNALSHYLSPLEVWALSFGCAVGWGAFVMPGTTFLPFAGPYGTAIGMILGAFIMLIIGINYHFLMNRYPDAGGTLTYSIRAFGLDHGLLSAWFLILVYIAIMWANATAIVLIVRNIFGDVLQFGFHYNVAGYNVYAGEVFLTISVILIFGFICMSSKKLALLIQTIAAIILICGVLICAISILAKNGGFTAIQPKFSVHNDSPLHEIIHIVVLSPWAFIGFESISNSTQGFKFSPRKSIWIMLISLVTGAFCYIALTLIGASTFPIGYSNWNEYILDLENMSGLESMPVFYAVKTAMGQNGLMLLAVTVTCGIITGLIGNYIAASRLIYAMAEDNILPEWFCEVHSNNNNPANAFKFLMAISVCVPFLGRAAIGWIVDVNTIGALIAYAYTSAAACKIAKNDGHKPIVFTGIIGTVISAVFFFYFLIPNIWSAGNLSSESYLILIIWSIFGLEFFMFVFKHNEQIHFGKSITLWLTLLFMIFFISLIWLKESTNSLTHRVLNELSEFNSMELKEHGVTLDKKDTDEAELYLQEKIAEVNNDMVRNSWIQMAIIVFSLLIMLNIYRSMNSREMEMEHKKIQAEESNKAKSTFLSNMSHDIRTPMNAIIGYTTLAKKETDLSPTVEDYLNKIEASSQHLLSLINDVLDMSRIENGKMELCPEKSDLKLVLKDVYDLFITQMQSKNITYTVDTDNVTHKNVMCDASRLNRVLLNLISNAYKFTPKDGSVTVTLNEISSTENNASYELSVRDTGMGMSPEFAATVFEAYSREKTALNIQGTGLGMAITKSIIDLMGGSIEVKSKQGEGTVFIIHIDFDLAEKEPEIHDDKSETIAEVQDFSDYSLLLVDDNEINREIAMLMLEDYGFKIDTADDGKKAYDMVAASAPGDYNAILMDVQMPIMNGYEATKAIRKLANKDLAAIPIIAMTANAFAEDIEAAKEAGMNGHLSKPIDIDKIIAELTRIRSS